MFPRCRRTIASAPPVVKATTGQEASKRSANIGSVNAEIIEARDA
jgi:hypothetical protein